MWEIILHLAKHSIEDSVKMLPFLFLAYLLIEYVEHKNSHKLEALLAGTGKFGFLGGALLGSLPQCGFSVVASNFYAGRVISMGTLVAVFVATSDEAIPVLVTHPESWSLMAKLILTKLIIALIAGFFTDFIVRKRHGGGATQHNHIQKDVCTHCHCESRGILYAAIRHTVSVFLFILLISFLLNALMEGIGEDKLSMLLFDNSIFQPIIASLIGLIPNCASSVVLTELLLSGAISFGSAVAGLCSGAGLGLLVLFRVNRHTKENLCVLGIVTATGMIAGWILQLLGV